MCCCTKNSVAPSTPAHRPQPDMVVLRVEDMTCGHCVRAVTAAVERDLPGTRVTVDLGTKSVTVGGTTDAAAVARAVASAGYSPAPAA